MWTHAPEYRTRPTVRLAPAALARGSTEGTETRKARNLLGLVLYHAARPADAERELRAAKDDCARLLGTADLETLFS
jgi:hypothetical protein